ncbi:MAG TPA: AAC(3) family N-acetyltransferase [Candidatus Hydrogenedentes bacterium]|nr:AAC(3) family N-acetyltransferase [Candidatus Hydrogenedentota bacterium]HPG65261.1 AAC(3) family N-acetyltransferase [Candidatus Hydrogenedentota bacterium]
MTESLHTPAEKPKVTAADIAGGLERLGIRPGDGLFAHSSLSSFGYVCGGAEAVVDGMLQAVGAKGTVAVPTFTWDAFHDRVVVTFDVRHTPTELGRVPEALRRRSGALRSEHVCHSIAALGPLASRVMGEGVRPFAQGSSMYTLYELDFRYVFLGCGFESCTALHMAEELEQVPYRYYRHFQGSTVIRMDGSCVAARSIEFLRRTPYRNDLGQMEGILASRGLLREARVGQARLLCAKTRAIVDTAIEGLRGDIGYLLDAESRRYLEHDLIRR